MPKGYRKHVRSRERLEKIVKPLDVVGGYIVDGVGNIHPVSKTVAEKAAGQLRGHKILSYNEVLALQKKRRSEGRTKVTKLYRRPVGSRL